MGCEGGVLARDDFIELLDRLDVLIDDRLVDQCPERFSGLKFRAVGRKKNEAHALRDVEAGFAVPSGIVEGEDDDAL